VEQNAQIALSVAHRACMLETGSIFLTGSAKEIAENPKVKPLIWAPGRKQPEHLRAREMPRPFHSRQKHW